MNSKEAYTPTETLRKKGERPCASFGRVMDNFHLHFLVGNVPHDMTKHMTPEGYYRKLTKDVGGWDKTYAAKFGVDPKKSEKRLGMTGEQFYQEIDRTVQELGIPMAQVSEAINRFFWDKKDRDDEMQKLYQALWDTLLPVYIALRKKGFVQSDLKS